MQPLMMRPIQLQVANPCLRLQLQQRHLRSMQVGDGEQGQPRDGDGDEQPLPQLELHLLQRKGKIRWLNWWRTQLKNTTEDKARHARQKVRRITSRPLTFATFILNTTVSRQNSHAVPFSHTKTWDRFLWYHTTQQRRLREKGRHRGKSDPILGIFVALTLYCRGGVGCYLRFCSILLHN